MCRHPASFRKQIKTVQFDGRPTCQGPLSAAARVAAVEEHVCVVARPVCCAELQERLDLRLQGLEGDAARGVVATVVFDQVAGKETLHAAQHAGGALVQLLHLVWRQQQGLAVRTDGPKRNINLAGLAVTTKRFGSLQPPTYLQKLVGMTTA